MANLLSSLIKQDLTEHSQIDPLLIRLVFQQTDDLFYCNRSMFSVDLQQTHSEPSCFSDLFTDSFPRDQCTMRWSPKIVILIKLIDKIYSGIWDILSAVFATRPLSYNLKHTLSKIILSYRTPKYEEYCSNSV